VSFEASPLARGPILRQSIGGLPSVRNDENHSRILFRAVLTRYCTELHLGKFGP
jgi:hypothetical protein